MRHLSASILTVAIASTLLTPMVSAESYTQCSQLTGNWQHVCLRLETNLDRANAAKDTAMITSLNTKRLSLLRQYARAVDRSIADKTTALRAAFQATSVIVIGNTSKPVCDGSLAIVNRTLDTATCRFSR